MCKMVLFFIIFKLQQNASLPSFSMSQADTLGYTASVGQARAIYLDVYTQAGTVYEPMEVEIVMPETVLGNNIPAATVCTVQMYYVGIFSVCAQSQYVNAYQISYFSRYSIFSLSLSLSLLRINLNEITLICISYLFFRMVQFKNDKAIVSLNALCNSANPANPMDPIDGLVRFCTLDLDSTFYHTHFLYKNELVLFVCVCV